MIIPADARRRFFSLCDADRFASGDLPAARGMQASGSALLARQWRYSRHAIAALDLGSSARTVQKLFAEAALASRYWLETEPAPAPRYAFAGFFALVVTGDAAALTAYARMYVERAAGRSSDPHAAALARALACSILGDDRGTRAALALRLPRSRRPGHGPWLAALRALAQAALVDGPSDLAPVLAAAAAANRSHTSREDLENQDFEPYLARVALAFAGQARRRGFDVTGADPHASVPLAVLRWAPIALPGHPWHAWPALDARHVAKIRAALAAATPRRARPRR